MAKVSGGNTVPLNFDTLNVRGLYNYAFVELTATSAKFFNDTDNFTLFTGTGFAFSAQHIPLAGTITSVNHVVAGDTALLITGATLAATDAYTLAIASDTAGLLSLTLNGADDIKGTPLADVLRGFGGDDHIRGGDGADTLDGGAGDDILRGGLGNDTLNGGAGIDTADYRDKTQAVSVALHGATAVTVKVGGVAEDTISNIENLQGGSGNDKLTGDVSANVIYGNDGNDILKGGGGNDKLVGGIGADSLTGGLGQDNLFGGLGGDTFIFNALSDSGITSSTRDRISDFGSGDKIDVHLIDAHPGGVNHAFVLDVNGDFAEGEIRQTVTSSGHLLVEFNADADASPDMAVLVLNHTTVLTAPDFIL